MAHHNNSNIKFQFSESSLFPYWYSIPEPAPVSFFFVSSLPLYSFYLYAQPTDGFIPFYIIQVFYSIG